MPFVSDIFYESRWPQIRRRPERQAPDEEAGSLEIPERRIFTEVTTIRIHPQHICLTHSSMQHIGHVRLRYTVLDLRTEYHHRTAYHHRLEDHHMDHIRIGHPQRERTHLDQSHKELIRLDRSHKELIRLDRSHKKPIRMEHIHGKLIHLDHGHMGRIRMSHGRLQRTPTIPSEIVPRSSCVWSN